MDDDQVDITKVLEAVRLLLQLIGRNWTETTIKYLVHLSEAGIAAEQLAQMIAESEAQVVRCLALEEHEGGSASL